MVYVTLRFEGLPAEILEKALRRGIGKTKSEILRLGLLRLDAEYGLSKDEDLQDLETAVAVMNRVRSGSEKVFSEKEIMKKLGK